VTRQAIILLSPLLRSNQSELQSKHLPPDPPAHPNPRSRNVGQRSQSIKQAGSPPPNGFPRVARTASDVHRVATDILFGKLSVRSQCLQALSNMMNHHQSIFKAKECLNEEFLDKFLFAVDTRFQIGSMIANQQSFVTKSMTGLSIPGLSSTRSFLALST
jgi:hypothetical protein